MQEKIQNFERDCPQPTPSGDMPELVVSRSSKIKEEFALLQQEQSALHFGSVSTGSFFWWGLLYTIPIIGWIICAVSAFRLQNVSRRNFARASLLRIAIGLLALCLVVYLFIQFAGAFLLGFISLFTGTSDKEMNEITQNIGGAMEELQDGKYDEAIDKIVAEGHPEIENVLNGIKQDGLMSVVDKLQSDDIKQMVDKYLNGGYDDLLDRIESGEFGDLGSLGKLYKNLSAEFEKGNLDYVEVLYDAVTTGKTIEGMDKQGVAMLTQIYRALDAEQKAMLAKAMDDYRVMGYEKVLEKYTNGDYDKIIADITGGEYGDLTPLIQRLMTLYIKGGF